MNQHSKGGISELCVALDGCFGSQAALNTDITATAACGGKGSQAALNTDITATAACGGKADIHELILEGPIAIS